MKQATTASFKIPFFVIWAPLSLNSPRISHYRRDVLWTQTEDCCSLFSVTDFRPESLSLFWKTEAYDLLDHSSGVTKSLKKMVINTPKHKFQLTNTSKRSPYITESTQRQHYEAHSVSRSLFILRMIQHAHAVYGQHTEFCNVTVGCTYNHHCALRFQMLRRNTVTVRFFDAPSSMECF
jgi:hypothetical protein